MIDFQFYLADLQFAVIIEQSFNTGKMLKSHASDGPSQTPERAASKPKI